MFSSKECGFDRTSATGKLIVTADDVMLLAASVGTFMSREAAAQWLEENWPRIESTINQLILREFWF